MNDFLAEYKGTTFKGTVVTGRPWPRRLCVEVHSLPEFDPEEGEAMGFILWQEEFGHCPEDAIESGSWPTEEWISEACGEKLEYWESDDTWEAVYLPPNILAKLDETMVEKLIESGY